jgi:hypothetical protein
VVGGGDRAVGAVMHPQRARWSTRRASSQGERCDAQSRRYGANVHVKAMRFRLGALQSQFQIQRMGLYLV